VIKIIDTNFPEKELKKINENLKNEILSRLKNKNNHPKIVLKIFK